MLPLYPEIKPYARHTVDVGSNHQLYVDESGTPDGIPVLFVHAGPGSGCEYDSRCFFNPEKYRIVLFDQRGAGRSTPHASVTDNTTQHLIADMEQIREFLGIEQWMLFGGGFGSMLSLAYAQAHPDNVLAMVMRGVFLGRQADIDWIYQDGASRFFPDHWEDFVSPIADADRGNMVAAYQHRIDGDDELARMAAIKSWSRWEADCSTMHPNARLLKHFTDPVRATARSKIALHYFNNQCFLADNQILDAVDKIQDIPGIIVQGRYDMVCPLINAFDLHEAWPVSQLFIVREAGHSATEPVLIDALIRATRDMALRFEADFGV
ncbi:MAG: prolyl aminopeptidase [Pseudomonadales bacterium]|nr:prolyl aminopeptidase [Pseudomonadales bacterium]